MDEIGQPFGRRVECPPYPYLKEYMGKHHDKIKKALEIRKSHTPKGAGFKVPGSMNKKKTGYRGQKANGAK